MSQTLQVLLSSAPIGESWGQNNDLSFNEAGATIHMPDLVESQSALQKIQKCARTLQAMKIPAVNLVGDWSLESQWHFWLGSYSPKSQLKIDFAELPAQEKDVLQNRISAYSWARKIINESPEDLAPVGLATQAGEFISQLAPDLVSYQIISGEELKDKGYVGIHGVGKGSDKPPALLALDFCPKDCSDSPPAAALVGKGITFDSGGYSLKSSTGMLHMKCDMGGAATVAASLALAIMNGLKKRVQLFLCCAENMVSGDAVRLSDIFDYRNGVSVEIVNTDAEGRLVLADGLIDASATGAPIIIDAATLTGAAIVAVGEDYNALFCMNDELAAQFSSMAESEFDPVWRLPLTPAHQKNCPSEFADTANSKPIPGGGAGGASNAAGFLSRFLPSPESGWIHLDLAACYKSSANSLWSAGATGRGIRSVAAFLNNL
ncbi:aminopeptidase PepB [Aliikangiella coralliicola]|uniref:Aminopeptidase PepB n=1 Tax=Aliikangiella coralliicola TaxID=2592383 RepID=A0A545UED6_9GAMM|nr:aminopeptidase PepB [Aliikangiella coralliicola]TQV87844.1 aminopeptidase PepB [Aliikangiella coralliicola]